MLQNRLRKHYSKPLDPDPLPNFVPPNIKSWIRPWLGHGRLYNNTIFLAYHISLADLEGGGVMGVATPPPLSISKKKKRKKKKKKK